MADFRTLSDAVMASPQIAASDLAAAKEQGITMVVNNRPDGESGDQPDGAIIEAAARELGLEYRAIPITSAGFSQPQVEAMTQALEAAKGKVLAYCRSGTRSTFLWSLAQAHGGMKPEEIAAAAANAGYDVSPIRPAIDMFAGRASG